MSRAIILYVEQNTGMLIKFELVFKARWCPQMFGTNQNWIRLTPFKPDFQHQILSKDPVVSKIKQAVKQAAEYSSLLANVL
jgi:hypothetical protein